LGWFIDPDERLVLAFLPGQQPVELAGDNRLPIPEFLELNLTVTQLFGWLKAGR
jgi:Uma2 family endonuclease